MMTTTELFDDAALTAMIAAATVLGADVKMGLNTAIISPSKVLALTDMVEPTYASYARQDVTFGPPYRDLTDGISSLSDEILWQQTGTPTPALIQGYFLVYGATAKLLAYEQLGQPFQMNDILDAIAIVAQFIQSSINPGSATVIV